MTDVIPRPGKIGHKNNFDLIRLLAALQVVQTHISSVPLSLPAKPDWFAFLLAQFPGVPIFFIVSGFLVTQSYRYGSGGVASYFARRALRIYPALWVNICLIVLVLALSGSLSAEMRVPRLAEWLLVSFFMGSEIAGNFFVGVITRPNGFYPYFPSGVTWTLVAEIGFYVLLPLILIGRLNDRRFAWISLGAWTILSVIVSHRYFYLKAAAPDATLTKLLSINTLTYLWQFMIGAICSVYWDRLRMFFERRLLFWLSVYLCAVLVMHFFFHSDNFENHPNAASMEFMTLLMAGVVLSFAFTGPNAASILRGNDLSYGIYLYHRPIIVTLGLLRIVGAIDWFIVFGGTIVVAGLSWYLIERRALQLKTHVDRWLNAASRAFSPSFGRTP
jgi:peptidoglycan/LPS O-acetylase OafA/YrhL